MTTKIICIIAISVTAVAIMFLADKILSKKKDAGDGGES
jgi:hypothetical protein